MTTPENHSRPGPKAISGYKHNLSGKANSVLSALRGRNVRAIWKSRIGWRIIAAVFFSILTVQIIILAVTLDNYRQQQLHELVTPAKAAIASIIPSQKEKVTLKPPFSAQVDKRLLANTAIVGLAIYSSDRELIRFSGEPVKLTLNGDHKANTRKLYSRPERYEAVLGPDVIGNAPYYIVIRLDASGALTDVRHYIRDKIGVMLLLSAFVTAVLMIALGRWLLKPIFFLRDNLSRAAHTPENPEISKNRFSKRDEIGGVIDSAQNLIAQNAENIRQIKHAAESRIHKLAYYDVLTGLPNRTLFLSHLNDAARQAGDTQQSSGRFAVIAMDIDHFKDINDTMGHNVGDMLLRAVGKRLQQSLPDRAVVARSGEDEFAVTMPLDSDDITARSMGRRIHEVIRGEPFKIYNENFQINASVGIATFPDDGHDPDQVLKNADIALNRAKEDGRNILREYLEDFDRAVQQRFQMLRDLRDALEKDHLDLHYQPQFDLNTGTLTGAEALLRWWKPDNSENGGYYIAPEEFIPVAEQSGLIVPIGRWVIRQACTRLRQWHDNGHDLRIAINVSGAQFHQGDFADFMHSILGETGAPAHKLELEMTESVFIEDLDNTIALLDDLHAMGIELTIDDFGTGYSALAYLRQFPIDRLKIDKSFIMNAHRSADDSVIARTIIRLAHFMNLGVIAEGVENKAHEAFLKAEGCNEVQGFRYARAMPAEEFIKFVKTYSGDLSVF